MTETHSTGSTVFLAAGSTPGDAQLVIAALAGITVLVLLVTVVKLHPLLGLTLGALVVGAVAGANLNDTVASFSSGVGDTVAGVGLLIALGAMLGRLLVDSGGADQIVDTIVSRASNRTLPWAMAAVGALIGLPMFFEIGLVMLIPVILLVTRRSGLPLMQIGIPTLAGLSAMHGLVPPHPGPLIAVDAVGADLGLTLGLGILVAIPTVALAGPVFSRFAARWVPIGAPHLFERASQEDGSRPEGRELPSFGATLATVLLPVALMLGKALADIFIADEHATGRVVLDFVGTPLVALLVAVLVAMGTLGLATGLSMRDLGSSIEKALPPIASITFIVAAGGGFKQVLSDSGISDVIKNAVEGSTLSPLFLAWFVAVLIRLATGSATVATITASGILADVAGGLSHTHTSLLVLAIGSGSLFFSHVNDAGFWLVKEYFGMNVVQTLKSWSIMETVVSVSGLVLVLALGLVI
ncbi:MAG: gluconate:H+ symporter [Nocardioidaceae bacterium]